MVKKKMVKKEDEEKNCYEKKEQKASVCLHIPHCFVQMRARSSCPADSGDKDLGAKANKGKQEEIS